MNPYTQSVNWLIEVYERTIAHAEDEAPQATRITREALNILKMNPYYEGEDLFVQKPKDSRPS